MALQPRLRPINIWNRHSLCENLKACCKSLSRMQKRLSVRLSVLWGSAMAWSWFALPPFAVSESSTSLRRHISQMEAKPGCSVTPPATRRSRLKTLQGHSPLFSTVNYNVEDSSSKRDALASRTTYNSIVHVHFRKHAFAGVKKFGPALLFPIHVLDEQQSYRRLISAQFLSNLWANFTTIIPRLGQRNLLLGHLGPTSGQQSQSTYLPLHRLNCRKLFNLLWQPCANQLGSLSAHFSNYTLPVAARAWYAELVSSKSCTACVHVQCRYIQASKFVGCNRC